VNSKEGDVVQLMSSAGLPANAIVSPYVNRVIAEEKLTPKSCTSCLKKCSRKFCVKDSLIKGHEGNALEGIFFAGKDAWKIDSVLSVKEVFDMFKGKVSA
ncbi:MAG: nitronate monooxygenase, partial [Cetobacterium sp.]